MTAAALDDIAERLVQLTARWDPFLCSAVGITDAAALLPSYDDAGLADLRSDFVAVAADLATVDGAALTEQERFTHQMASWQADLWPRLIDSRREEFGISPYKAWCVPTVVWSVLPKLRIDTADDETALATRMSGFPALVRAAADALDRGTSAGRTAVRRLAEGCVQMLDTLLGQGDDFAATIAPAAGPQLATGWPERFAEMARPLRPALAEFRGRLAADIVPAGRDDERPGVCWIPGGESGYLASVAEHTTIGSTPEQIHRSGHEAVAELAAGVLPIAEKLFGTKTIAELVERLRGDRGLRFDDPQQMLTAARAAFDRGQAVLGDFVGVPPTTECEIRPMSQFEASRMMQAYYRPGDHLAGRPGIFWLNTDLERAATRYELATLVAHESVPGHHVQWSRAREVDLPRYRTLIPTTAFIEGWAMYCESSGAELGLVTDELATVGVWSSLSWRASRLVVDTGLHALGWSRSRAIHYLMANSATSLPNAEGEVDRYIGNPGQALAYYTGLLALRDARDNARRQLGEAFDLRAFNDRLLSLGSPPLPVAAAAVDGWIRSQLPTSEGKDK